VVVSGRPPACPDETKVSKLHTPRVQTCRRVVRTWLKLALSRTAARMGSTACPDGPSLHPLFGFPVQTGQPTVWKLSREYNTFDIILATNTNPYRTLGLETKKSTLNT
jgi:hypothetical protein